MRCFFLEPASALLSLGPSALLPGACISPSKGREWWRLEYNQKHHYIAAVKCLWSFPTIRNEGKFYNGFVHVQRWARQCKYINQPTTPFLLNLCPQADIFLPWHRKFLNNFETSLSEYCAFSGKPSNWEWAVDVCKLSDPFVATSTVPKSTNLEKSTWVLRFPTGEITSSEILW
jgi:hypothetical protein